MNLRLSRRNFLFALAIATIVYSIPGGIIGYRRLELTRFKLGLGTKLLYLPDIHIHEVGERDYVVELVEDIDPDITALGGDLWDSRLETLEAPLKLVDTLKKKTKHLVLVLGNHEHWAHQDRVVDLREALRELEDRGVVVLVDDRIHLGGLVLGGIDWRENPKYYRDVVAEIGGTDILLSHSPDVFPYLARRQSVLLAGHTYGGQICLPGSIALITNSYYGYKWGLYRDGDKTMYVARGLGEKTPPRIYCSREALLVE